MWKTLSFNFTVHGIHLNMQKIINNIPGTSSDFLFINYDVISQPQLDKYKTGLIPVKKIWTNS